MFSFSISAYSGGGRTYNPIMRLRTHCPDPAVCFTAKQVYPVACYLSVLTLYTINPILSIHFGKIFLTRRTFCAIMSTPIPKSSKNARKHAKNARFLKLIGKSHILSGKRLKKRRNFCIIKIGLGNLSSAAVLACESEVIYVKHYRNQKHHKGI